MQVIIRRLTPEVPMPEYKTSGACAFDIAVIEEGVLQPNERRPFRTGLVVKVPDGHILLLAPRSSNAKKGVRLANGIGYIDRDYCGPTDELFAYLHNVGNEPYTVQKGERIMQGVIVPCPVVTFIEGETGNADRGGFGTTG
ncbi:MAG: dUTP diphosphatase [Patescibacteria group bacterium]|jgi:dUTP pyrophosphatase